MTSDPHSGKVPHVDPDKGRRSDEGIDSNELFKGAREVVIRHNSDRYVLRITRQGKLILNK